LFCCFLLYISPGAPQVRRVRGCAGVDKCSLGVLQYVSLLSNFPTGFVYILVVEGYLRGRHPIRSSRNWKMGTMKARVEVRLDFSCFPCMYSTTRCTVLLLINRYTHTVVRMAAIVPYERTQCCIGLPQV
jgi:hypothetical protein